MTIRQELGLLVPEGATVEMRALGTPRGVASGYFTDADRLAEEAARFSGAASGVYITANPVRRDLLARASNRTKEFARHVTGDRDITRRIRFIIDIDPVRPPGICATEKEHRAVLEPAEQVESWLIAEGWPEPIVMDSGNGAYLLFQIDLPNDDASTQLVRRCLQALDLRFSDERVVIDTAVGNAARLIRVPGTLNAKGDNVPKRPHRLARILKPGVTENAPLHRLERLAAGTPETLTSGSSPSRRGESFDAAHWIEEHSLTVASTAPYQGGWKWILDTCPWDSSHTNRSAYIIQFPGGAIASGCLHLSCRAKGWHDLRDAIEPGWRNSGHGDSTPAGTAGPKRSQAQILIALTDAEEIFRATDGETAYATITANGHHETWPVRSKGFRRWLTRRFYEAEQKPPGAQALQDALGAVEARAQFAGAAYDVYVRLAAKEGAIFLDLANPEWEVVEITGEGWRIAPEAPVKFRRAKGMLPLPRPLRAGSLDELRRFVNVRGGEQWALLVAWLVAAARPVGPFPVLVLGGEHGTAKSTTAEVLRRLVDPSSAMLRAEPRDVRDVMIAANNGWMVALDNLSSIPPWLSDCLCRLATGGGFSTRELFSNQDETIFEAQRPVILNGIEEIVTRPDLLDRAILLDLAVIGEKHRKGAAEFWDAFEAARPRLLGALLDAVSAALRNVGGVRLPRLPRMADFAIWIEAAAPALGWREHHFLDVYSGNRAEANKLALDASPVGAALLAFADRSVEWTGPANKLLDEINRIADEPTRKAKSWPTTPRSLSSALRRIAPNLRALGVEVRFDRESSRERRRLVTITSTRVLDRPHRPDRPNTANIEDFASDARPEHVDGASPRPSDRKFAPDNGLDDVDGLDATFAGFSPGARTDRTGQPIVLRPARKQTTKMLGEKCSRHPVTARPECRDCQVSRAIDPDDPRNDLEPELDGVGACVDGAGPGPSDPKSPADVAESASDVEVRI